MKKQNISRQTSRISEADLKSRKPEESTSFPLAKINFILMAIAAAVIIIGFLLMLGSGSTEQEFNPDIFSTRRIVVGPTIAFVGFLFMGFAIIYNPQSIQDNTTTPTDSEHA